MFFKYKLAQILTNRTLYPSSNFHNFVCVCPYQQDGMSFPVALINLKRWLKGTCWKHTDLSISNVMFACFHWHYGRTRLSLLHNQQLTQSWKPLCTVIFPDWGTDSSPAPLWTLPLSLSFLSLKLERSARLSQCINITLSATLLPNSVAHSGWILSFL